MIVAKANRNIDAAVSLSSRIERLLWSVVWSLFARWTWNGANYWRLMLLRLFGASIGQGVRVSPSAMIWRPRNLAADNGAVFGPECRIYNMNVIRVGKRAVISQRAFLCGGTHDIDDPAFPLVTREIVVEDDAWIASEAFVAPGVTVHVGAVLGARGCAFRNLDGWTVYGGNPAVALRRRALGPVVGDG
jgi:putative colanic acid biosynthesis acetyltransferase WcaF